MKTTDLHHEGSIENKGYFFSLKWKVLLLLGFILLAVSASLTYLGYIYLQKIYQEQISESIASNSSALLSASKQHLVELSRSVTLVAGMDDNMDLDANKLQKYVGSRWDILEIEWGLNSFTLIGSEEEQIFSYGLYQPNSVVENHIRSVFSNLNPKTWILCSEQCLLYAATPYQLHNGEAKVIVTTITLIDFIIGFTKHNNLGAVFLKNEGIKKNQNDFRPWGYSVAGITNRATYLPLLVSSEQEISPQEIMSGKQTVKSEDGRYFYYHSIPIHGINKSKEGLILLIADITDKRSEFYTDAATVAAILSLAFFVTLSILSILLHQPMERVIQQAKLLPLLAESGFDKVREEIKNKKVSRVFRDELDILDQTAISLSHKLELMEEEIEGRTNALEKMALYDVLTGLANRRQFVEQLNSVIKNSDVFGERFAVVFIDLDDFKRINDFFGHSIGDELLILASERLSNCVRNIDVVARLGGDEFTILIPQIKTMQCVIGIVEHIIDQFKTPLDVAKTSVSVTPSIGIAVGPDDGNSSEELMRCADLAMYQAKMLGKNCYHFFTEEMNKNVQRLILMENDLYEGIDSSQFRLHYQPIIDLKSGQVVYLEGLLRWHHPKRGLLGPIDFIDTLESNGQIVLLGPQIFELACLDLLLLRQLGFSNLVVAINISAKQFQDEAFIEKVSTVLNRTGISPTSLKLEITENTLMLDIDRQAKLMQKLRDMGFTLSIDDFGTGYSSLSYLKKLPVDELKIDRSFIMDIPDNVDDMEITSAITEMAHKLRLKVVAEGVETEKHIDYLHSIRCEFVQGYYYSRPEPMDRLLPYLQDNLSQTMQSHAS